jgi:hypothetical protein
MLLSRRKRFSVILPSNKASSRIAQVISELGDQVDQEDCNFLVNLDGRAAAQEASIRALGLNSVKIFHEKASLSQILNFLIEEANTDLIVRADDDDIYLPNRLRAQIDYMEARKDVGVLGSAMYLQRDGVVKGVKYYPEYHDLVATSFLFNCHGIAHPVAVIRKSTLGKHRYTDCAAEDMDLWARLISDGVLFSNLNIPLFIYNFPQYSDVRLIDLASSVKRSIGFLLAHYHMHDQYLIPDLTSILFDQTTPLILTPEQTEVLSEFTNGPYFGSTAGRRLLTSCALRYNKRLYAHLVTLNLHMH